MRALIVDDEPLAREGVRELLKDEPDVVIVGECADGLHALEQIRELEPDLVFLDIQMPEMDGFGVLAEMNLDKAPAVIFTTAYDEFALKAFDVNAVDYLLKPLDPERFKVALKRVRSVLESHSGLQEKVQALLEYLHAGHRWIDRLLIKGPGRIFFVKTDEVDWIEAEGDYVRVYTTGKKHLLREKISDLEKKLDPARFVRIHRSTIVNKDRVKELYPLFYGEYHVLLSNGTKLTVSRSYKDKLFSALNYQM